MKEMRQGVENRAGLVLLRKPVRRVEAAAVVREGSTGRVVSVMPAVVMKPKVSMLPRVWAVAETGVVEILETAPALVEAQDAAEAREGEQLPVELAFYRKYTEAMVRRYVRLSMAAGRVPSLLGRELFRGHVSSYRMTNFEDVVVYCNDMEKLLGKMRSLDQQLIKRIAMQHYPQGEAAVMLRISLRTCMQTYGEAIDRLTALLLEARMLEPLDR